MHSLSVLQKLSSNSCRKHCRCHYILIVRIKLKFKLDRSIQKDMCLLFESWQGTCPACLAQKQTCPGLLALPWEGSCQCSHLGKGHLLVMSGNSSPMPLQGGIRDRTQCLALKGNNLMALNYPFWGGGSEWRVSQEISALILAQRLLHSRCHKGCPSALEH